MRCLTPPVVRKKCCLLLSRTQWKLWVNFQPRRRETPFFVVKTVGIFDSLTTELAVVLPVLPNRNQRNCAILQTIIIEFERKQTVKDRLLQWGTAIILCYISSHFEVWSGRFFWSWLKQWAKVKYCQIECAVLFHGNREHASAVLQNKKNTLLGLLDRLRKIFDGQHCRFQ